MKRKMTATEYDNLIRFENLEKTLGSYRVYSELDKYSLLSVWELLNNSYCEDILYYLEQEAACR